MCNKGNKILNSMILERILIILMIEYIINEGITSTVHNRGEVLNSGIDKEEIKLHLRPGE